MTCDAATSRGRCRLWQLPGPVRRLARRERRRGRCGHRSQRRGQDHADARDLRPDPSDARQHAHGGRRSGSHAAASHCRTRHRACSGKSPTVPAHDGGGQPPHGRLHSGGASEVPRTPRCGLPALSPPARTTEPACRHAFGRRAADVRDRPRIDVGAATALAGRAIRWACARRRPAGVRPGRAHPRPRAHGADRRAERPPGAARG